MKTYRGYSLIAAESFADYEMSRTLQLSVDHLREQRGKSLIDMRIILERHGYEIPDDASHHELVNKFFKFRDDKRSEGIKKMKAHK